ncbi:MAG TPA: nucleoside hydrolase-like domain-containing protein [Pseudonocardiaceae bacterium]|nr:nucleoside hydrolase-like domain-containing protein [Pseudonocardiaceae bacterium]
MYLQAWGGMNTIARALKSIQDEYQGTPRWQSVYAKVSAKAIIEASGFQDDTYTTYIAPTWPRIQVNDRETGYNVWGYPRTRNTLPQDQVYYTGAWMKANIIDAGPLGAQEYTYGDGRWNGDPGYTQWKGTVQPKYTFVSEGDNVAFLPLIDTGLRNVDPTYGGWGGRLRQQTISPNLFTNVPSDTSTDGTPMANYDWSRWFQTEQLDFAQRMRWGVTPKYGNAEHEPVVHLLGAHTVSV